MRLRGDKVMILICMVVVSCVHELPAPATGDGGVNPPPPPPSSCSSDTVYFSNTIFPLINSLCGKSGCHGSTNRNAFALNSYSTIVSRLGTIGGLNNSLQEMAEQLSENPTLNYTPPTSDEMQLLTKWISQGAKNNQCNSCDTTQFTYAAVISLTISTYCRGCHSGATPAGGVDLSSITAIQSEIVNNPGRLLGSIEWTAPYTGAKAMPEGQSQLSSCMITQIKKWIQAGAPNN